jgi:hypothetical protein
MMMMDYGDCARLLLRAAENSKQRSRRSERRPFIGACLVSLLLLLALWIILQRHRKSRAKPPAAW